MAPLLVYPAVSMEFGAPGFASMAVGQSLGLAMAVVCELGWSVVGPQRVASETRHQYIRYYRKSMASRLLALAIGAPVVAAVGLNIGGLLPLDAAVIAVAFACNAYSPIWLLIGLNRPKWILLVDAVPRLVANAIAAVTMLIGAGLWTVGIANIVALATSIVMLRIAFGIPMIPRRADFRDVAETVRDHAPLTLGRSISVLYTVGTTALVGTVAPHAVAGFAATDRLTRMGLTVLTGIPNRLQSWLGGASHDELRRRSNQTLLINLLVGVLAGVGCAVLVPPAAALLFVGEIEIERSWAVLAGAVVLVVCASRGAGLVLVAGGFANWIGLANLVAAALGVVSVSLLAPAHGVEGALAGVLVAESAGLVAQLLVLILRRQRPR